MTEPTTEIPSRGRPIGSGSAGVGLHKAEPQVALCVWRGPLSQLQCRLNGEISYDKLKELSREKRGNLFTIDISPGNSNHVFNALRRRLGSGDGG